MTEAIGIVHRDDRFALFRSKRPDFGVAAEDGFSSRFCGLTLKEHTF